MAVFESRADSLESRVPRRGRDSRRRGDHRPTSHRDPRTGASWNRVVEGLCRRDSAPRRSRGAGRVLPGSGDAQPHQGAILDPLQLQTAGDS